MEKVYGSEQDTSFFAFGQRWTVRLVTGSGSFCFISMEGIDMSKKFQNAFSRQGQNSMKRKKDYMRYTQSLECTLQLLESQLHDSDDTLEIIQNVLKTACLFYQGDWAGFLQIDIELGL